MNDEIGLEAHDDSVELVVTDISRSGPGVAREASGRVVFVPFTAPGDRVRVRVLKNKRDTKARYAEGVLLEVLEPSAVRVKPRCPAFSRCGGCQWQHLPYELQWKTKSAGVVHALERVNVKTVGPTLESGIRIEELPADLIWEYRNRVQLRGEHSRDGTILGFYGARSHEVIPIERCDIARAEINAAWPETLQESKKFHKPFKVELEVAEDGALHKSWNQGHAALGFRQVHDAQNEKLRNWVRENISPGRPLLDLFGGSGNLSAQFIGHVPEIHCVDLSVPRVKPASFPESYSFHRAPVGEWINSFSGKGKTWSAILDPPREGLGSEFTPLFEALERIGVAEVVLVGCDADAWARDVSRILKRSWQLKRAAVLDLFPQTPHVESLAVFSRVSLV